MFSKDNTTMFSFFGTKVHLIISFVTITVGTLIYQYSKRSRQASIKHQVIYVISNIEEWNAIEKDFSTSVVGSKVIGLDCEWTSKGKVRQPVALLQMATSDICVLFRLCHFHTDLPLALIKLLANEKILKVGVDIWSDRSKLLKDYQIVVKGCLDLRSLVDLTPEIEHITNFGLSGMASSILKFELCKERKIRCSNWQQDILSKEQITYAVQDAAIALQIFKAIMRLRLSYTVSLLLMLYSEEKVLYNQALLTCATRIDVPYKSKNGNRKVECNKGKESNRYLYLTRSKPLYDNCRLQAPDGDPLCVCDMKKAQWYLDRKLGEIVENDPFTVRLNFEPSGRPVLDNKYYTEQKENCCVVCGRAETYIKKKIVPHEYRRHLPNLMKSHLCHDILLLCIYCHQKSSEHDLAFRIALAEECNAPLCANDNKTHTDHVISRINSAARALIRKRENLPKARIEELENLLKNYYGVEEITSEILQEAANLDSRKINEDYVSHGLKVVQYKSRTVGLAAFEAQWRQHFLDTMKPQHLPKLWSIDHNHERLFLQAKTKNLDFDVSVLSGINGIAQELDS